MSELSCPICYEPFDDLRKPLVLPHCGHSLCRACLDHIFDSSQNTVRCPIDRTFFDIEEEELGSIPKNFSLLTLVERGIEKRKQGKVRSLCDRHQKKLSLYNFEEKKAVCIQCVLRNESKGTIEEIKEIVSRNRKPIEQLRKEIGEFVSWSAELTNRLSAKIEQSLRKKKTEVWRKIDDFFDRVHHKLFEEIEARRGCVRNMVSKLLTKRHQPLRSEILKFKPASQKLSEEVSTLESKNQNAEKFIEEVASGFELKLQSLRDSMEDLQKIQKRDLKQFEERLSKLNLQFSMKFESKKLGQMVDELIQVTGVPGLFFSGHHLSSHRSVDNLHCEEKTRFSRIKSVSSLIFNRDNIDQNRRGFYTRMLPMLRQSSSEAINQTNRSFLSIPVSRLELVDVDSQVWPENSHSEIDLDLPFNFN